MYLSVFGTFYIAHAHDHNGAREGPMCVELRLTNLTIISRAKSCLRKTLFYNGFSLGYIYSIRFCKLVLTCGFKLTTFKRIVRTRPVQIHVPPGLSTRLSVAVR